MRTLEFEIKGQRLSKKADCDFAHIVAGSVGYLRAKFHFDPGDWRDPDDWRNCKKVAGFWSGGKEYAALLDGEDSCVIPKEALTRHYFLVQVTGANGDYRIKTTKAQVSQEVT